MKWIVFFILVLYVGAAAYLYLTQDKKVFKNYLAKEYIPRHAKILNFITSDGLKFQGAYLENKKNAPLILYFSGNANNVIEFIDKTGPEIKNYNFIGFNYPGYAGSDGKPCEKCILKYAVEIYERYKPDIVMGRSLGSAVATFVANQRNVKKVVLITPFDSVENLAKSKYPFFPISILLKYKFKEYEWIKQVQAPVSVLYVKNDEIVSRESLENLLKNIKNLHKLIEINASHADIYEDKKLPHKIEEALK